MRLFFAGTVPPEPRAADLLIGKSRISMRFELGRLFRLPYGRNESRFKNNSRSFDSAEERFAQNDKLYRNRSRSIYRFGNYSETRVPIS
jgi:hypothetical protein